MSDEHRPPSSGSEPSDAERTRALAWIEARLDAAEADEAAIAALSDEEVRAALDQTPGDAEAEDALRARIDQLRAGSSLPPTETRRPDDRPPAIPLRSRWKQVRTILGVLATIYAGLWVFSTSTTPASINLAELDTVPQNAVDQVLPDFTAESVARLRNAQTSTLGLFPRYDAEMVATAEADLRAVYEEVKDRLRGVESQERRDQRALSAFLLGKAALMREDEEEARRWLRTATEEQETVWAARAENLLALLDDA